MDTIKTGAGKQALVLEKNSSSITSTLSHYLQWQPLNHP